MAHTKVTLHRVDRRSPFCVRWRGDYDPLADKQKRYSKAFRLKSDAERFRAKKQFEFDNGKKRDRPERITIKAFCKLYMERRNHEWREKTRVQIVNLCNRLIHFFGEVALLTTITSERASGFWSQARSIQLGSEGKELSRYTRNRLLRDAKTMFKHAVTWEYITNNPFDGIQIIRVGKKSRRWHYIKPNEYRALLKAAPDLRWKVIYALAYTSSARFGELFNLQESNIDFDEGKLLIYSRNGTEEIPPFFVKDHEDREIPLPRHTLKLLAGWFRIRPKGSPFILLTPERFERVQARWLLHRSKGKPWINDYLVNNLLVSIRRHAKWANIKLDGALTMHGFRKSCCQNWADHLPINVVKELMGHADISTTTEFYSTVSIEHLKHVQWITEMTSLERSKNEKDVKWTSRFSNRPIQRVTSG